MTEESYIVEMDWDGALSMPNKQYISFSEPKHDGYEIDINNDFGHLMVLGSILLIILILELLF